VVNALNLPTSSADMISQLDALAAELTVYGWTATIRTTPGRMSGLHARNPEPEARALSETIYARPRADGTWSYWWPWAEPIAETASAAAAIIVKVLRPAAAL
jgi:hypothetical protein